MQMIDQTDGADARRRRRAPLVKQRLDERLVVARVGHGARTACCERVGSQGRAPTGPRTGALRASTLKLRA